MPRLIPTAGYPSRTEAVVALAAKGLSTADIAEAAGTSRAVVRVLLCHARSARTRERGTERTVRVPVDVLDRLQAPACARGLGVNELIRRLLDCIADDGLVPAILDDKGETADA